MDGFLENMSKKFLKNRMGFTTLEILLVVAMIALIASTTITIYVTIKKNSDLDVSTNIVVNYIRRAQSFSQTGKHDSQWGVLITGSDVTLFKGSSYPERDNTYDEVYSYPVSLTHSGLSEIVFSKVWGNPDTTGDLTLSDPYNSSAVISINSKGALDY